MAAALFVGVLLVEGALRPGYDPMYHTGSALSLGERGWIQIANFLQLGLGAIAFAIGVLRTLNDRVAAALIGIFGLGMIASGVFTMDPMRGYPPGTPAGTPEALSWHQQLHDAFGPIAFLALLGACASVSRHLTGGWRVYTVLTAVAGLASTAWTAVSWASDAPLTGLAQRVLIVVYLLWVTLVGMHLARHTQGRGVPRATSA